MIEKLKRLKKEIRLSYFISKNRKGKHVFEICTAIIVFFVPLLFLVKPDYSNIFSWILFSFGYILVTFITTAVITEVSSFLCSSIFKKKIHSSYLFRKKINKRIEKLSNESKYLIFEFENEKNKYKFLYSGIIKIIKDTYDKNIFLKEYKDIILFLNSLSLKKEEKDEIINLYLDKISNLFSKNDLIQNKALVIEIINELDSKSIKKSQLDKYFNVFKNFDEHRNIKLEEKINEIKNMLG